VSSEQEVVPKRKLKEKMVRRVPKRVPWKGEFRESFMEQIVPRREFQGESSWYRLPRNPTSMTQSQIRKSPYLNLIHSYQLCFEPTLLTASILGAEGP
jgi:hypothetical protein